MSTLIKPITLNCGSQTSKGQSFHFPTKTKKGDDNNATVVFVPQPNQSNQQPTSSPGQPQIIVVEAPASSPQSQIVRSPNIFQKIFEFVAVVGIGSALIAAGHSFAKEMGFGDINKKFSEWSGEQGKFIKNWYITLQEELGKNNFPEDLSSTSFEQLRNTIKNLPENFRKQALSSLHKMKLEADLQLPGTNTSGLIQKVIDTVTGSFKGTDNTPQNSEKFTNGPVEIEITDESDEIGDNKPPETPDKNNNPKD